MVWAADLAPVDLFAPVVSTKAFAIGLLYGALAYLATGLIAALRHRTREGGGVAFAGALFLSVRDLYGDKGAPIGFALALVLLAVGGHIATRARPRLWTTWYVALARTAVALVPGAAALVVVFPVGTPTWLRFAAGASAVLAGVLVHDFDATQGPRGGPFLFLALGALAVYFTVPDTELPLVMLGVAVPLALISVPQPLRRLGPAGATAAMGAFSWVVVLGGRGRAGSIVAGLAALGLLLVEPLGRRIPTSNVALGKRRRHRPKPAEKYLFVIGVASIAQVTLGAFCAKIAGREGDAILAALMAVPALVLLAAGAPYLLPTAPKPRTRRPRGPRKSRGSRGSGRQRRYAWMHQPG
jgi:hypothetical protein